MARRSGGGIFGLICDHPIIAFCIIMGAINIFSSEDKEKAENVQATVVVEEKATQSPVTTTSTKEAASELLLDAKELLLEATGVAGQAITEIQKGLYQTNEKKPEEKKEKSPEIAKKEVEKEKPTATLGNPYGKMKSKY